MFSVKNKALALTVWALFFLWMALPALAQPGAESQESRPFYCIAIESNLSPGKIRSEINDLLAMRSEKAVLQCRVAELMKRVGDTRAEEYYEKAIAADNSEPAYELFYADYLRNFRGAQRPLFARAEKHYFAALNKYRKAKRGDREIERETERRIERGIIALYQEDGLPLLLRESEASEGESSVEQPYLFFSTTVRGARLTTDFEAVDDVRAFTAEALFASSSQRLNRALRAEELERIVRAKEQFETFNRLRFRYRHLPVLDLFYKHRKIDDAQITNFFEPGRFNDFRLNEVGAALEKSFNASRHVDVFLRGAYRRIARKGLIEFLPSVRENVNQLEARAAVSHFFGPDKATLETVYVFQDINPDVLNPPERNRRIFAATLTYQIFRPLPFLQSPYGRRFETRGLHLSGGAVRDREKFGVAEIRKSDFFFGASLRGLGGFDVSVQPTFFNARVTGNASQTHRQYRTSFNLLYRIKDEEKEPSLPERASGLRLAFLHLVLPFRHDVALRGLDSFENWKLGVNLDAKLFSLGARRTTFLVSFGFSHQRFYHLNKDLNLINLSLSMGF